MQAAHGAQAACLATWLHAAYKLRAQKLAGMQLLYAAELCCWHAVLLLHHACYACWPVGQPQLATSDSVPLQSTQYWFAWCRSVFDCKDHSFSAMDCMLLCNMCHLVMKEVEQRGPGDHRAIPSGSAGAARACQCQAQQAFSADGTPLTRTGALLSLPLHGADLLNAVRLCPGGLCMQHQAAVTAPSSVTRQTAGRSVNMGQDQQG